MWGGSTCRRSPRGLGLQRTLGGPILRFVPPVSVFLWGSPRSWQSPYPEPSLAQVRSYKWDETVLCELDTITSAWTQARHQALDRLSEEAVQVGWDAVVGVHLQRSEHDWAPETINYLVSGTAIRFPGSTKPPWRA